jgi:hypothetical protein
VPVGLAAIVLTQLFVPESRVFRELLTPDQGETAAWIDG